MIVDSVFSSCCVFDFWFILFCVDLFWCFSVFVLDCLLDGWFICGFVNLELSAGVC